MTENGALVNVTLVSEADNTNQISSVTKHI